MTPRQATFAAFLSFGVSVGLWSGSVPVVAAASGLSPAQLGLAVTLNIACTILGLATAGRLARSIPIRVTLVAVVLLMAVGCALALLAADARWFFVLFLAFGFIAGICDATMNAEGTAVERDKGKPVLAGFHAAASFASALSAGIGGALSVAVGTWATGILAVLAACLAAAIILTSTPLRPVEIRNPIGSGRLGSSFTLPIVLIGLIAGFSMAGEAAALMFAASTIREQAPTYAAWAGFGVTAFGLFQAGVRAVIDRVRRRFTDMDIVLGSIVVAAFGFVIVATGSSGIQSAIGFAVIGVGTAAIVPCSFAMATRVPGLGAAQAIGLLSLVSALPRVPQPLGFGEIASHFGYAAGYGLNAALMVAAFGLMLILRGSSRKPR